ncbi:MAG: FAD-binding oxidoreductase [Hyphomicrobiaceae bacterium]
MAPIPDPFEGSEGLPEQADVVVIGGGIIGVCTALSLAERGVSVALVEKGEIAGEQSSRNWGWCRQMGRDPREIPLIVESLTMWRSLNEHIGAETGYRQSGILYTALTDKELEERAAWLKYAREYQLDSHMISGEKVAELLPGGATTWKGALYTPTDGRAEPTRATSAIAKAAQDRGAFIARRCAARGIETSAGRISAVVTERGTIRTGSVVLAGGAWSGLFAGNAGVSFPQLKVVNSVMRTVPMDAGFETSTSGGGYAVRKRLDGGYTIAQQHLSMVDIVPDSFRLLFKFLPALMHDPASLRFRVGRTFFTEASFPRRWQLDRETVFERVRVLDPEPVRWVLDDAMRKLERTFPVFKGASIVERWAGAIDVTPDAVPVISEVDGHPGFFIASGFSGHGFGLGPGAGRLVADLVTGAAPLVDPSPFRYKRLIDGTKPQLIGGF